MLTDVVLTTASRTLALSMGDKGLDVHQPYVITNIDGLGPVPASVTMSQYAGQDNEVFQFAKTGKRNIVISIGYRPDYEANDSISKLRQDLYSALPTKSKVTLNLKDDTHKPVKIEGIVESHDPVIFSAEPTVQISIVCPESNFSGLTEISLTNYNNQTVNPSFIGDANTGFIFELYVHRPITSVVFKNGIDTNIDYRGPLAAGDILKISTVKGSKGIFVTRALTGLVESGLEQLYRGSLSMTVGPATTAVGPTVSGSSDMPYRVAFVPKYVGI